MYLKGKLAFKQENTLVKKRKPIPLDTMLFLMAIPFVLFIFVFSIVPLFGWYMAFVNYSPGMKLHDMHFVGFKYFINLFSISTDFLTVMRNTLIFSLLGLLTNPFPPLLAIMINEVSNTRYKRAIQTITSLPNFTSWIIVYALTFSFLSIDDGLINTLLLKLNLIREPMDILGNSNIVWYFQTLLSLWKNLGWGAIIYIGAISGIDQELYEAAYVDGATRLKRIWHITVPGIMPTFVVLTFLSAGNLLGGAPFDQIFVFHNGLVHGKIQTLSYYVYSVGLKGLNFSLSTALGIFQSVVSITLLTIVGILSKKVLGRSLL